MRNQDEPLQVSYDYIINNLTLEPYLMPSTLKMFYYQ